MPKRYRIFFHHGAEPGLKTRVSKGEAWIDGSALHIKGSAGTTDVPMADLLKVELFRLHGLARAIRVEHQGGTLYLAVVRFMIGQFASVNFFGTGELQRKLAEGLKST